MLPEVEEYFNEVEKTRTTYRETIHKLEVEFPRQRTDTYYRKADRAGQNFRDATKAARQRLRENSKTSLISWLTDANNGVSTSEYYWGHAEQILKILPATQKQIDKVANDGNWCSTWDGLRARALTDGALDEYITLQYQQNASPWRRLQRNIRMQDGEFLERAEILKWFHRGAKELEFKIRRSTYRFRLVEHSAIK